jgi:hypothetical protein
VKYEKKIQRLLEEQAATGRPRERTEPRTPDEIGSFLLGFGLSGAAARRVRTEWLADRHRAWQAGYEAGEDDAS